MTTGPGTAGVQVPPAGGYRIDPARSTVTFSARHLFGLRGLTGSFAIRNGEIFVADPVTDSTVQATIDAASFHTGNSRRDADITSAKYLDAAAHPDIIFAAAGLRQDGTTWLIPGTLTAHGHPAPCVLTVVEMAGVGDASGAALTVRATTRVDRYVHQVTAMKGMAGQYLELEITAYAERV